MADAVPLFSNFTITASMQDKGRLVSFAQDWLGALVTVTALPAGAKASFTVQWSNDNVTWFDPGNTVGTLTAPGTAVGRFPVQAPYWRLATTLTGASVTCTASALC